MRKPEEHDEDPPPAYESLWDRAILHLDEKSQSLVRDFKVNGCKPEQLLADVNAEVEKCKKKQWSIYTTSKGRRIFVRDLLKRITGLLAKVTSVGDAVAQYDPVHLSLPWALARFLLIAAVSDISTFGAMLESMEFVTDIVARYTVIEGIFLRPGSKFQPEIKKAITRLYVAILKYVCKATKYFQRNTLIRISISVFDVEKDATKFMQEISDEEEKVDKWIRTGDTDRISEMDGRTKSINEKLTELKLSSDERLIKLQGALLEMTKPVGRMADQLENVQCSLEKDERAKIIKWISSLGSAYQKNHRSIANNRLKNSGQWLLNTRKFRRWTECSSCSVLWLYGGAGYGKSFLVSLVVDLMLKEREKSPETAHLAYFYCTRDTADPKRAQPVEILRSIVRQLSCENFRLPIRKPVLDRWIGRVESDSEAQLDIDECVDILVELTRDNPAIICIDALDECNIETRRKLLEAIGRLIESSEQIVKIFVSSRREDDFLEYFEKWESLQISATDNREDIINFVDEELKKSLGNRTLLHGNTPPELIRHIRDTLLDKAEGMFRWVSASLQSLCDPLNTVEEDIREALRTLPGELEDVYGIICEQIERRPPASRTMARNAIRWLLCGNQPLSCEEMIKAILPDSKTPAASITKEQILSICCNFVKIDGEVGIFRFVHLSVREYLEKRADYELALNHATVAFSCLTVCSSNAKPRRRGNVNNVNKTFYDYAQVYWPLHCQHSKQYRRKEPLETPFREFLCGGKWATKEFASWCDRWTESWSLMELDERPASDDIEGSLYYQLCESRGQYGFANPIYVACTFGFAEVIEDRRQAGMGEKDSKSRNQEGRDLYEIALRHGQKEIVHLLRATTDLDSTSAKQSTLLAAASLSELGMVKMLLEGNPDLHITDEVVYGAATSCDLSMMTFLSEEYLDFVVTKKLLLAAASNEFHGHKVVPFLLEHFTTVVDEKGISELLAAACYNARRGYGILQYVLENSDRVNITEEVVVAAASNRTDAYQMLRSLFKLDKAVQVTEEIIEAAAGNTNAEPMRYLLSHASGLTINWQIIFKAIQNRNCGDEVLLLLLGYSKDSVKVDEDMLYVAMSNTKLAVKILDILLPRCDRTLITNDVLQRAAGNNYLGEQLITRLLGHVPRMQLATSTIEAAARNFYFAPEILNLLIAFDNNVPVTTEALEAAAINNECGADALELLLNHNARLQTASSNVPLATDGERVFEVPPSVIEVAASNSDSGLEIMELLFRCCKDISITSEAVVKSAGNFQYGEQIIRLWQKKDMSLSITRQAIEAAARNQNMGLQVLNLLLRCDRTTQISDDAMKSAAMNPYRGLEMIKLMLPRWKSSDGYEKVFYGASRNAPQGVQITKYIISRKRPVISPDIIESCVSSVLVEIDQITTLLSSAGAIVMGPEIPEAASGSSNNFFDILATLKKYDANVPITDAAIYKVIERSYNVIEDLEMLRRYGIALTITEGILKAIVGNYSSNESIIAFLSQYQKTHSHNDPLPITEEVFATALANSGMSSEAVVKSLLQLGSGEWNSEINEKRLQTAARVYKAESMISILAEHATDQGNILSITPKVLVKAAGNQYSSKALETLLELLPSGQEAIVFAPEVLSTACKNPHGAFEVLVAFAKEHNLDFQVSESLFNDAVEASLPSVKAILKLWRQQGRSRLGHVITYETLERAAKNFKTESSWWGESTLFHTLLRQLNQEGIKIHVTKRIFELAIGSGSLGPEPIISYFRRICRIQGLDFLDLLTSQSLVDLSSRWSIGSDRKDVLDRLLSSLSVSKRSELVTEKVALGVAGNGNQTALSSLLSLRPYEFTHDPDYYLNICALQEANWSIQLSDQRALLKKNTYTNAVHSKSSHTPLSSAARFNELNSVKMLLKHGKNVNLNHIGSEGLTPLHYACMIGALAAVEALLKAGADKEIRDDLGRTAADLAAEKNNFMAEKLVRGWN